jgi:NADPH-dependent curcumin reductase CurA
MVKARQWLLNKKPENMPELDGDNATFKLTTVDLPDPKDDEVLVKLTYLSNDPAQRGWISPYVKADRLYIPPIKEGTPMGARGIAEVIESKSSSFKKGDMVIASTGWTEYSVIPAKQLQPAPDLSWRDAEDALSWCAWVDGSDGVFRTDGGCEHD